MKKLIGIFLTIAISAVNLVFIASPVAKATTGCSTNGSYSESTNTTTGLRVVKFEVGATKTSNASCTFVVPSGITSVRVMSVSGGGGGGWDGGGGGAGGGVNKYDHFGVTPGESITVIVGGGGAAATSSTAASAGGNSSFKGNFASGGAGGGSKGANGSTNGTGSAGGGGHKGAGTTGGTTGGTANGSAANINFSNNGGGGTTNYGGGGGGGGGAGSSATSTAGGNGGVGFYSSIEGAGATYAGGGGGGTYLSATASSGGTGGGGSGGTASANGGQGVDGLGGGGGGGGLESSSRLPGRGGAGVVLVTYRATEVCNTETSTSGNYTVVVFANTTSQISNCRTTWTTPSGITSAEALIVGGGGGGGGMYVAGGGGAGGYIYNSSLSISGTLTIQVGGGGKGGETFSDKSTNIGNQGFNGGDSSIQVSSTTTTAVGGGGGGSFNVWYDGRSGGSGGGGAVGTSSPTVGVGGSATSGQGNAGGNGYWGGSNPGGGGGGSASSGSAGSSTGGTGGAGTANPIAGVTVGGTSISTLAAGGGGGSDAATSSTGGSSGIGGGGGAANNSGSAGRANTGSGGGGAGGGSASSSIKGGDGSAGIVVIRYLNLPTVSSVTISGTAKVGQVLNGSATVTGGGTTTYQWQVADTVNGTYTDIASATSNSFTLTNSQLNKFIKLKITQTNASGTESAISSATNAVYLYDAPTLTAANVSVSGSAFSGSEITASASASGEGTISYSYQWYRIVSGAGTTLISGATNRTYTLTDSDLLSYVYVRVTATNESSSSSAVIGSMPATPKIGVATPTISGVTQSGQLLSGSTSSTFPGDATVSYKWLRGDTAGGTFTEISGANDSTYLLGSSDVGKHIKFQITISNATKGASGASVSSATNQVADLFTITYDTQGGSAISDGSTTTGGSIASSPGTPTRAGYSFNGWFAASSGGSAITFPYAHNQSSNFTLYAQWSANSITITYDTQGGSAISDGSTTTGGSIASSPGTPTRAGYSFNGWFAASSGGSAITFPYAHNQSSNFTLYAQWSANSITITYDTQGGSAISDGSTTTGGSIASSPGTPTRAGYSFNGWFAASSGGSAITFPYAHNQSSNFTLYAQWSANSITITYDTQGGSAISDGSTTTGGSIASSPGTPTRAGYSFNGWFAASSGGSAITFPYAHNQSSNFTLYAQWSANSITITYDTQGGSAISDGSTTTGGSIASSPGTPTRAGYSFNGWFAASSGGSAITFPYAHNQSSNFTLYAQWSANSITITYDTQGGSAISDGSTTTGGSIASSPGTPTRAGYSFNGWFAASSGGSAITFPYAHNQSSNFTLYAQWSANSITITYDTQGGSAISDGSTTTGGSIASSPGTPTRAGYSFNGWFAASSGGSAITFPYAHNQSSNFTLYAQWSANSITITYDTQGGSAISDGSTTTGGSIASSPGTPTRAGYSFNGWFAASSGGSAITFPYAHNQSSNFTLYAQWSSVAATPLISSQPDSANRIAGESVTFSVSASVSDGGTLSYQWYRNDFVIEGATSATLTIDSLVSGLTGNYKVEITNSFNGAQSTVTSNIATLTVNERTYTVTYTAPDKDGGSVPVDTSGPYTLNTTIQLASNTGLLTKSNYVFQGWRTASDSTVRIANSLFTINEDVTFIAVWSQIYQLSFDANGGSGSMSNLDGPTVTIPTSTFTRSGYTFNGWNSAANGSGLPITVGFTFPLPQNITIYAQWSANTLTITYSTQGGSAISTGSTTTGGAVSSSPGTPTRTGYAFNGWFVTSTGGNAITFPYTHNQTSNFTLYAQWSISAATLISNLSLRPSTSSTELIQSFSANTLTYSVYLENKISAVTAFVSRTANSSISIQVRINDSGFRKLTFSNTNLANSGSIPVPLATSTLVIRMFFVDRDYIDYTITLFRDQETKSATNNQETVTPLPNVVPADQVISSVKFLVNSTEVNVTPSFNVSITSYTVTFSVDQSVVILRTTFTAPGVSLRVKINSAPFRQIGVSGESSALPLNKGSNNVILRVISADGTLKDYNFTLTRANS